MRIMGPFRTDLTRKDWMATFFRLFLVLLFLTSASYVLARAAAG